MSMRLLSRMVYGLLLSVLAITLLVVGKPFFMPLSIAGTLALVFLPLSRKMERKGVSRLFAAIICGLIFTVLIAGVILLLSWHVKNISADFSAIRGRFLQLVEGFRRFLHERLGITPPPRQELVTLPASGTGPENSMSRTITLVMGGMISLFVNFLLVLVYMVLLMYSRSQLKEFLLRVIPDGNRSMAKLMLIRSARVVQQYLSGMAIVILFLWITYSIGFSIVGIRNAIFFAILCGLLEIVPFVGNITGSTLTCVMALSQGGGIGMAAGVLCTYGIIQFLQFYVITPLVMQTQIRINPLFNILVLIAGNLIWGIPGMILAIPFLGIAKIIFDHIEALQPIGYLIGKEKTADRQAG